MILVAVIHVLISFNFYNLVECCNWNLDVFCVAVSVWPCVQLGPSMSVSLCLCVFVFNVAR